LPKCLEFDAEFLESIKYVFKSTEEEIMQLNWDQVDFSYFWVRAKLAVVNIAKERQAKINKKVNERLNVLNLFYLGALDNIKNGMDSFLELESIKTELNDIYKARVEQAVDNLKGLCIDDHVLIFTSSKIRENLKMMGE
jgi:hypothetical protein